MLYDIIIIGSGPAGLTAAIYAQRAKLSCLVIEKEYISGGQVNDTYEIENYPGLNGISGFDLATKFKEHADAMGAVFVTEDVISIETDAVKVVRTNKNVYEGKTIIIATGASHRKLGIAGEEELAGMGVSYCATCDGAFYKNKTVVVVGGGDLAVEDAIFLARGCEKVYLVHRRNELRAAKRLSDRMLSLENVEVLWNCEVKAISGNNKVQEVTIFNNVTNDSKALAADGVFVAVGIQPRSERFIKNLRTDEAGYIIADESCCTSVPGVFAAGDVRKKHLRQIVTALADGANAVSSAEKYINL